ncbi:hypothetical protein RO07_08615 [Pandoraea pulmonicola]|uniref:Uncharacterized protein n=1 Tax=Pandoraea pulmonicola TaxID=93221 RepID=A0ABM5RYH2_PANPU|nr:hypothetical protein RO07_08615 [Pandoraea pulmonicola]
MPATAATLRPVLISRTASSLNSLSSGDTVYFLQRQLESFHKKCHDIPILGRFFSVLSEMQIIIFQPPHMFVRRLARTDVPYVTTVSLRRRTMVDKSFSGKRHAQRFIHSRLQDAFVPNFVNILINCDIGNFTFL